MHYSFVVDAQINHKTTNYLEEPYFLASGYFYISIREYVVRAFAEKGLIKPNNTGKRFNFNAYAWTFGKQ